MVVNLSSIYSLLSLYCLLKVTSAFSVDLGKKQEWFETKPTKALNNYHETVKSVYLRHTLFETQEMADLAMDVIKGKVKLNDGGDSEEFVKDPFGDLARKVSMCHMSREEGGKIGWVDNPKYDSSSVISIGETVVNAVEVLLTKKGIEAVYAENRLPKAGDVIQFTTTRGIHIVRVDDVLLAPLAIENISIQRGKLKGDGSIVQTSDGFDPDPVTGKKKTYHIITNGCQMNVSDSERLEGEMQNLGLEKADENKKGSDADVVLLNTCSIRDHAEQKVYDQLGPVAKRKRKGEPVSIVVAGCVAQQEGENLLRRVPEVDVVMGPQYVGRIGELLKGATERGGHQIVATDPTLIMEDISKPVRGHKVRAWVNVIYGCNEHCTYCVVPATRGVEQSRTMESIFDEVQMLADQGYKEVTLLGQNIDAYGRDMTPKRTFAELLHYLNNVKGIERIRYVTSHPRYFSNNVISAIADLDKVCECFHLPFQAGDDEVLRRMRRGYTFDSYMRIIDKIKSAAPDASICGDVIVGFPGETDEQFQKTLDLMNAVKFDNLNTFAYSERPNTEAALWDDQVSDEVKSERLQKVQRLATQHAAERSARYLNQTVEVLVEDRNAKNPDQVMGRTRQGRLVFFDGNMNQLLGKLVDVQVTETRPWSLTGSLASVKEV